MTKEKAIEQLREELPKCKTIYVCRVNYGSKSRRQYIFLKPESVEKNKRQFLQIDDFTWMVAFAMEVRRSDSGGIATADIDTFVAGLALALGYEYNDLKVVSL